MTDFDVGIRIKADGSGAVIREFKRIEGGAKNTGDALDKTDKSARKAGKGLKESADGAKSMTRQAGLLTGALAVIGLAGLAKSAFDTFRSFESLHASLKTVTGSAAAADSAFANIEKFAKTTPFNLNQSVQAFVKLKALGLDPSMAALRSYGNTAAAMGKDLNQMIEAVADASTGEFERLKEFGIKASSQGDKVSFTFQGVTTTIGKNAGEIEGYLRSIGDVQFAGAMADQMNTANGLISNLQDNISALQRALFQDTGAGDFIKVLIAGLADGVQNLTNMVGPATTAVTSFVDQLKNGEGIYAVAREAINFVGQAFDTVSTAIGPFASEIAGVLAALAGAQATWALVAGGVGLISIAVRALSRALLANPIVALITGIAVSAKLIYDNWDAVAGFFTDLWDQVKSATSDAVGAVSGLVSEMIDTLADLATGALKAGKDFVTGLVKGITSGLSSAVNAAKNLANSALDTVKSIFKTQSPSKAMIEIGQNVGKGLAIGILKGEPGAAQAAAKLAASVTNTFGVMASDINDASKGTFGVLASDVNDATGDVNQALEESGGFVETYGETISSGIGGAFADVVVNSGSFADSMKALWKRIAADYLASGVATLLGSLLTGNGVDLSGFGISGGSSGSSGGTSGATIAAGANQALDLGLSGGQTGAIGGAIDGYQKDRAKGAIVGAGKGYAKGAIIDYGKDYLKDAAAKKAAEKAAETAAAKAGEAAAVKAGETAAVKAGGSTAAGGSSSSATTGLWALAIFQIAVGLYQANSKKQQAKINKQLADRASGLSGGFQNDSLINYGRGAVGADGGNQEYLQYTATGPSGGFSGGQGKKNLINALKSTGANVEVGLEGVLKISGDISRVQELSANYTQEVNTALEAQIAHQSEMLSNDLDREDRQAQELDIRKRVAENWAESVRLANSLDFASVAQKAGGNLAGMGSALRAMSKDGIITAKELRTHLGGAADSIIAQMSNMSGITVQELLKIIDPTKSTAQEMELVMADAAKGMSGAMKGAAAEMSTSVKGTVVNINAALRGIEKPKDLSFTVTQERVTTGSFGSTASARSGVGDSFHTGTGGYREVPYTGYSPNLEKGEIFNVIPASQAGASAQLIDPRLDFSIPTAGDSKAIVQKLDKVIEGLSYISGQLNSNHTESQGTRTESATDVSDSLEKIAVGARY